MALTITHATTATGTDAGNGEIRKTQWNEAHSVSGVLEQAVASKTASFTFDSTHAEQLVNVDSASAVVATIPTNASVPYTTGTRIKVHRANTGTVKIVPDTGVTLRLPTGIRPNVFMGCKAIRSAATAVNVTTDTAIPFATADAYDTHDFHDTVTNNTRFTIPANLGIKKVMMSGVVYADNCNVGWVVSYFLNSNDSLNYGFNNFYNAVGLFQMATCAPGIPVADSSYIEMYCRVQSDTSIDFTTSTYATLEVTEIDAQGWIAYRYGTVEIQKIGTNEWIVSDQTALG